MVSLLFADTLSGQILDVCPISGISIVDPSDPRTWRIDFKREATPDQRRAAEVIVATFDVEAEEARRAEPAPPVHARSPDGSLWLLKVRDDGSIFAESVAV